MNEANPRPQHLFILRFWAASHDPAQPHWRGSIEQVPSGQKFYFTALSDLVDFIVLRLAAPANTAEKGKYTE